MSLQLRSPTDRGSNPRQWMETLESYASTWMRPVLAEQARLIGGVDRHGLFGDALSHLVQAGGKQVRPLLVLAACELTGGEGSRALPVACALEFLHVSSLVFDDLPCMDDALSRRGVPTLHCKYDEATAVLVGLGLIVLANELLSGSWAPSEVRQIRRHTEVMRLIGIDGMLAGQAVDLALRDPKRAKENLPRDVQIAKTSALMSASLAAGAYTGHANDEQLAGLIEFGHHMGWAYQIADDELDLHEDVVGSQVCVDEISEPRKTSHLHRALQCLERHFPARTPARDALEAMAYLAAYRGSAAGMKLTPPPPHVCA